VAKSAKPDNFERIEGGLKPEAGSVAPPKPSRRRQKPHDEVLSWFGNDEDAGRPTNWLNVAI
jgi:hypothetical protein